MDGKYKHGRGGNLLPGIVKNMKPEYIDMILNGKQLAGFQFGDDIDRDTKSMTGSTNRDYLKSIAPAYEKEKDGPFDKYWALFVQIKNINFKTAEDLVFIFSKDHTIERDQIKFVDIYNNNLILLNEDKTIGTSEISQKIFDNLSNKNN